MSRAFACLLLAVALLCGLAVPGACGTEARAESTFQIILEDGDTIEARKVERVANGFIRYSGTDGPASYIAVHKIREIRDAAGVDRGSSVLRKHGYLGPAAASKEHKYRSLCFQGRDGSRCGSFLITEVGVLAVLDGAFGRESKKETIVFLEYGAMKNIGPRSALGVTVLGESGGGNRAGFRARYRRWLGHDFALDIAPGIIVASSTDDFARYKAPGLIGMVAVEAGSILAVVVEGEIARIEWESYVPDGTGGAWRTQRATDFSLRAGARGGSYVGVGFVVVSAVALAVLAASIHTTY